MEGFHDAAPTGFADSLMTYEGVMTKHKGSFGFIQTSDGTEMFVMPAACKAFGGQIPAVGTHVKFEIVTDQKTGMPRAEGVQKIGADGQIDTSAIIAPADTSGQNRFSGTVCKDQGNFGFIQQDSGGEMFFMPISCVGFAKTIPPIGTRVNYTVIEDSKTGRPRAEDVMAEGSDVAQSLVAQAQAALQGQNGMFQNQLDPNVFSAVDQQIQEQMQQMQQLQQHEQQMQQMQQQLAAQQSQGQDAFAWDGALGIPGMSDMSAFGAQGSDTFASLTGSSSTDTSGETRVAGTISKHQGQGRFGFILQDNGAEMFVMPIACIGFGKNLPPIGTRVTFTVVIDSKTGRPRAEAVLSEDPNGPVLTPGMSGQVGAGAGKWGPTNSSTPGTQGTGHFLRDRQRFGFIQEDSGEEIFCLPGSFKAFGFHCAFPPIGTRVIYDIVPDPKTVGRNRAENVRPEDPNAGYTALPDNESQRKGGGNQAFQGIPQPALSNPTDLVANALNSLQAGSLFAAPPMSIEDSQLYADALNAGWGSPDGGMQEQQTGPARGPSGKIDLSWLGNTAGFSNEAQNQQSFETPVLRGPSGKIDISWMANDGSASATGQAKHTGTFAKDNGKFGFIQEDSGNEMFVLPCSCKSFGLGFPPVGTRVAYDVVNDTKTGRNRADNVMPEDSSGNYPVQEQSVDFSALMGAPADVNAQAAMDAAIAASYGVVDTAAWGAATSGGYDRAAPY